MAGVEELRDIDAGPTSTEQWAVNVLRWGFATGRAVPNATQCLITGPLRFDIERIASIKLMHFCTKMVALNVKGNILLGLPILSHPMVLWTTTRRLIASIIITQFIINIFFFSLAFLINDLTFFMI